MRRVNGQILDEIAELLAELTGVAELTQRVELAKGVGGDGAIDQGTEPRVRDEDDEPPAIEFITENGFSIFRHRESRQSPAPENGTYRFTVSDGFIEQEVGVEISSSMITEVSMRTRGRIKRSSSFWISCAERHLANYLDEHSELPDENQLIAESLDIEDVLSAIRWNRSNE